MFFLSGFRVSLEINVRQSDNVSETIFYTSLGMTLFSKVYNSIRPWEEKEEERESYMPVSLRSIRHPPPRARLSFTTFGNSGIPLVE